jgi:hypothetical protein
VQEGYRMKVYKQSQWWFVFRVEQKNPTWGWDNHCVLVDAVRAYTDTEAEMHAYDRNPVRQWQSLSVKVVHESQHSTAMTVRKGRNMQVQELKQLLNV